jgi:hypothetical protein
MTREIDGLRDIARELTRALGRSVSIPTAVRYTRATWPTPEQPHPLVLGWRGNGVRFLRLDEAHAAWVKWYRDRPPVDHGSLFRPRRGDRRRAAVGRQLSLAGPVAPPRLIERDRDGSR